MLKHPGAIDRSALLTNQAAIALLLVISYFAAWPALAAAVALVMAIGTVRRRPGFRLLYTRLVRPAGWLRPDPVDEDAAPHIFAQGLGAAMLLAATAAFAAGLPLGGWALVGLVVGLAALNLITGFCAGCAVHYWLGRLKGRWPGRRVTVRAFEHAGRQASPRPTLCAGVPAILYFYSADCAACRTGQRPALAKLLAGWRAPLQVIEIDAQKNGPLADFWGVLTLPTTIVLDAEGNTRRTHHGVATAEKLAAALLATTGRRDAIASRAS